MILWKCVSSCPSVFGTCKYVMNTEFRLGVPTKSLDISKLKWNFNKCVFTDTIVLNFHDAFGVTSNNYCILVFLWKHQRDVFAVGALP